MALKHYFYIRNKCSIYSSKISIAFVSTVFQEQKIKHLEYQDLATQSEILAMWPCWLPDNCD